MEVFNSTHRILAKHLYAMTSQMTEEERRGATLALSAVTTFAEDSYIVMNNGELRLDFFVQCYDVLTAASLAQKMLHDDGLLPEVKTTTKINEVNLMEAEKAYLRVNGLINKVNNVLSTTVQ
jgi:ribosomal protein L1